MQSLMEAPQELPAIAPADWHTFFAYWNHLHESLRGDVKDRLNHVARLVGADQEARRMLKRHNMRDRLMATLTFGNLREASAWRELDAFVTGENSFLALTAMRALIQIDAKAAIPLLLSQLNRRKDWSLAKIASMLHDAGGDVFAEPLAAAAQRAPTEEAPRLIHLLASLNCTSALPVVRQLLTEATDEAVIAACLPMVNMSEDLPHVRHHLFHASGTVRAQAALALGRIGVPGDETLLADLLGDPIWWVRYRAAQALVALPFLDQATLQQVQAAHADPFARDMLKQVLAERTMA
ncbi:HEAT repeat protein [compost metagenome]